MMILEFPRSIKGRIYFNGIILSSFPQMSNIFILIFASLLLYLGAFALPFSAEIKAYFAPGNDNLLYNTFAEERSTIELSIEVNILYISFEDLASTILQYFFNANVPLKDFGREPTGLMRMSLSTIFLFLMVNSTAIWPPKEEPIRKRWLIFNILMNFSRKFT